MFPVLVVILFFLLDTPHNLWQVCIMSNAEECTQCNTSNVCASFVRNATTLEMIYSFINYICKACLER